MLSQYLTFSFVPVGKSSGSSGDQSRGKTPGPPVIPLIQPNLVEGKIGEKTSSFENELIENASTMPSPDTASKRKPRVKFVKSSGETPAMGSGAAAASAPKDPSSGAGFDAEVSRMVEKSISREGEKAAEAARRAAQEAAKVASSSSLTRRADAKASEGFPNTSLKYAPVIRWDPAKFTEPFHPRYRLTQGTRLINPAICRDWLANSISSGEQVYVQEKQDVEISDFIATQWRACSRTA
jgi:hypothetical protein